MVWKISPLILQRVSILGGIPAIHVEKYSTAGEFITTWGSGEMNTYNLHFGIATDALGDVYFLDSLHECIKKFTATGVLVCVFIVFYYLLRLGIYCMVGNSQIEA
jgi:hypothetical protein